MQSVAGKQPTLKLFGTPPNVVPKVRCDTAGPRYLRTAALTLNQPSTIYGVCNFWKLQTVGMFWDGGTT